MKKGQAAIEVMIIMSVSLIILMVILFSGQERMISVGRDVENSQVNKALDDLSDTADFVYSQAIGATSRVYITIPSSVREIIVGEHYFEFIVYEGGANNSYIDITTARLEGNIDSAAGSKYVTLINEGSHIEVE